MPGGATLTWPTGLWRKDDGGALTAKITGTRMHSPMLIIKEFDCSSPYLYKAVATGQSLVSAEIKWYRINYSGQEMETVELRYEKITWKHNDGNIIFSDAWNERQSA